MEEGVLIIAGIFGIWYLVRRNAVSNLLFQPTTDISMSFEGSLPVARINLLVQNTSNVSLQLNSFAANVYANNTYVGNVSGFTPVMIAANSEGLIPVDVKFNPLGIVQDIIRAFQTKSFAQNIELRGSVNAEGVQVPIDLTFEFGG